MLRAGGNGHMAYDERALRGIGGWLAFLIVILAGFSPLRIALELVGLWSMPTAAVAGDPVAYRWIGTVMGLVRLAVTLYVAWRLYAVHRPETVRIAILGLWTAAIGITAVELLLLLLVARFPLGDVTTGGAVVLGQGALFAAIWTLYLRRSRRVANTYTPARDTADVFR